MNIGIDNIASFVGMSFENICIFLIAIGGLIFFAKDFRIGVIMQFIGNALLFMLFYAIGGLDYGSALVLLFFWLTILTLTLYFSAATKRQGAFI